MHSPIKRNVLQHKINPKKLKPGLVASYDIQFGNGEGLFWFQRFINLSLTYWLRHLPTYLQPPDQQRARNQMKVMKCWTSSNEQRNITDTPAQNLLQLHCNLSWMASKQRGVMSLPSGWTPVNNRPVLDQRQQARQNCWSITIKEKKAIMENSWCACHKSKQRFKPDKSPPHKPLHLSVSALSAASLISVTCTANNATRSMQQTEWHLKPNYRRSWLTLKISARG